LPPEIRVWLADGAMDMRRNTCRVPGNDARPIFDILTTPTSSGDWLVSPSTQSSLSQKPTAKLAQNIKLNTILRSLEIGTSG
jgi:hypothetical protein